MSAHAGGAFRKKEKKGEISHSATMPAFAGVHAFQTAEILLSRRTAA